jgi:hypothetical protein
VEQKCILGGTKMYFGWYNEVLWVEQKGILVEQRSTLGQTKTYFGWHKKVFWVEQKGILGGTKRYFG